MAEGGAWSRAQDGGPQHGHARRFAGVGRVHAWMELLPGTKAQSPADHGLRHAGAERLPTGNDSALHGQQLMTDSRKLTWHAARVPRRGSGRHAAAKPVDNPTAPAH